MKRFCEKISRFLLDVDNVTEDEIDEVKQILETEMVHACDLAVPLIAEVKQGINWYEAK